MEKDVDNNKFWVVILGGCGFVGRNLVEHLISDNLVGGVRVVDKVPPQMAWLNKRHTRMFNDSRVEFVSANLINPESCAAALRPKDNSTTWDLVVNCAGETKVGQNDPVYREGILTLSTNCAKECARLEVKRYIEISSGCVYSANNNNNKNTCKESSDTEPWNMVAKWKLRVEEELKAIHRETGLQYTILRPVHVYGQGDRRHLTPRLLIAAVYGRLGEVMKLMWGPDLRMDTIHIRDLCAAVWLTSQKEESVAQIYNVVDENGTTQGFITDIVASLFNIKCDYLCSAISHLAKNDLPLVLEELNDKHLHAWAAACHSENIENTPLDPTMTEDMLLEKHLAVDGDRLRSLGYCCKYPKPTLELLKEVIEDYIEMRIFPECLMR